MFLWNAEQQFCRSLKSEMGKTGSFEGKKPGTNLHILAEMWQT